MIGHPVTAERVAAVQAVADRNGYVTTAMIAIACGHSVPRARAWIAGRVSAEWLTLSRPGRPGRPARYVLGPNWPRKEDV